MKKINYQNVILSFIFFALCGISYQLEQIVKNDYKLLTKELNKTSLPVTVNGGYVDVSLLDQ